MPDDLYSQAMKEYYTLLPPEVVPLVTLEFTHASFVDDLGNPEAVRVVNDTGSLIGQDSQGRDVYGHRLTLEDDAPLSAGEQCDFVGVQFDATLPQLDGDTPGTVNLSIDNVTGLLSERFDAAIESRTPIGVNLREYLDNDKAAPTGIFRGLTVGEAESTETRVTMSAGYDEITNRSFPSILYLPSKYVTLAR